MHDLAKSLPPPRKQNIACDACRSAALSRTLLRALLTLSPPPDSARSSVISSPASPRSVSRSLAHFAPDTDSSSHSVRYAVVPSAGPMPTLFPHVRSIVRSKTTPARPSSLSSRCAPTWDAHPRTRRHHAQQATSEKKRVSAVSRRPRAYSGNNTGCVSPLPHTTPSPLTLAHLPPAPLRLPICRPPPHAPPPVLSISARSRRLRALI